MTFLRFIGPFQFLVCMNTAVRRYTIMCHYCIYVTRNYNKKKLNIATAREEYNMIMVYQPT